MTTTAEFQVKPDYYMSHDECLASLYNKVQTNPRYKNFTQDIFHAGDESQFEEFRDETNGQVCLPNISLDTNLFVNVPYNDWEGYANLDATAVINTFRYIFYKFKKGIFVKIVDNQLRVFLPFSNASFTNEWGDRIHIDPKYKTIEDFLRHISEMEGRTFNPKRINGSTNAWYANSCLVRYEWPINEGDTNVSNVKNMLEELCENRKLPDMEFFINRRDFPILTKDGTEPYNNIWDSENQPLISHAYSKFLPIFSMSGSDRYADLLIPTHEDWARVQSKEGKFFPKTCKAYNDTFVPWEQKTKSTGVFRGGSTGCGVTVDSNQRLKLSYISSQNPPKNGEEPYLDAGITNWNLRPRKLQGQKYLQTIEIDKLPFDLVNKLTPDEQSEYKYIINVDGHVTAFRLSLELSLGSVILLVQSKWNIWYSSMLKPYVHYVPIREDLSNIIEQIQWCRNNDDDCKQIAINARAFYDKYLRKDGILDYLQRTFTLTKRLNGIYLYNYISPLNAQLQNEYISIDSSVYPSTTKTVRDISSIPYMGRFYGLLQGIHWVINMINTTSSFENVAKRGERIFINKLGEVRTFNVANFNCSVKTTSNPQKIKEHIHETFVGTKCINQLLKYVPNFVYTFGLYQKEETFNVISEKVGGICFSDWIKSDEFNMKDYLMILIQLSLAIQVAQNNCGLVHYDLTPWNIIINKVSKPVSFDYIISHDQVIRVKTTLIPIIIDYGKSHVVYDNNHHGFINMYKASRIQDILSLLTTSVFQILQHRKLSREDFSDLLMLANFMTGTKYHQRPFQSAAEMKNFLRHASKYSNLISSNKYELEEKGPMNFVKYIQNKLQYQLEYGVVSQYNSKVNKGNGRQVFEYILSSTVEEKAQTYLNVFIRLKHCSLPQPENKFFLYYAAQSLEENLLSVSVDMKTFLSKNSIDPEKYVKIFISTMRFLLKFYREKLDKFDREDIHYELEGDFKYLELADYTSETFLLPETILKMIKSSKDTDLSEYKEIVEYILLNRGKYELSEEDKNYYLSNFKKLLSSDQFVMKVNTANIQTIRDVSKQIYREDIERVSKSLSDGDCSYAENYIQLYTQILNKLDE